MAHFQKGKMAENYFEIQKEYEEKYGKDTVVLYQKGKFMELMGVDNEEEKIGQITRVCQDILNIVCSRVNTKIAKNSRSNPQFGGFQIDSFDKFTKLLLQNNFTVIVVEEVGEEKGKGKTKGRKIREVTKILSPATNTDENLETGKTVSDNNFLMCIYLEFDKDMLKEVSSSMIDLTTGESRIHIINKDATQTFENQIIKNIKVNYPKEIIVYTKNYSGTEDDLINMVSIQSYMRHIYSADDKSFNKNIFKVSYQNTFLEKIFTKHGLVTPIEYLDLQFYPNSIICYILLLSFSYDHSANILNKISKPTIEKNDNILELSQNTIQQLNLIEGSSDVNLNVSNLFNIINKTSTIMGKRLLKYRLLNPITDKNKLNQRYNNVDKMREIYEGKELWEHCEDKLKVIKDLEKIHHKINLLKLEPMEFIYLHNSYNSILNIIDLINNMNGNPQFEGELTYPEDGICSKSLSEKTLDSFKEFIKYYNSHLNMSVIEKYTTENSCHESLFISGVYEELDEYEKQLKTQWKKFKKLAECISQQALGENFLKIESTASQGYYFVCTKANKKHLQKLDDYEFTYKDHTHGIKVFNSEISEYSNSILELQSLIKRLNKEKFNEFQGLINDKYNTYLKHISKFVAEFDVVKSSAKGSSLDKLCRPKIKLFKDNEIKRSYISAKKVRNLIIEKVNPKVPYIANDIEIGKDKNGILLYGLNFSGKSSLLRSVASSIVLAQSGFFVPSSSFTYYPFRNLITKISIVDNLFKNESLFVSELKQLKIMLENSDENSLIISDEIMSGTEVTSSMSLAAAAIISLVEKKANFLITSHSQGILDIPQIKELEDNKKVWTYHLQVLVENNQLVFNRTLKEGKCPSMYGLEIAEYLNLGKDFIKNALKIRRELNSENELCFKNSRYNSDVFSNGCAVCGMKENLDIHHITFQEKFKKDNNIPFDKNIDHNLICLCKKHHNEVHQDKLKINGYVQTGEGIKPNIIQSEL